MRLFGIGLSYNNLIKAVIFIKPALTLLSHLSLIYHLVDNTATRKAVSA